MNPISLTPISLMPSQEAIWEFLKYFEPDDPGRSRFNVMGAEEWAHGVSPELFRNAVADVTERHDALRMVFADIEVDARITFRPRIDLPIAWEDLSFLSGPEQRERLAAISAGEYGREFDLRTGPLWSVRVIRLGPERHLIMVCLFHMIADGWSVNVVLSDLAAAYLARVGTRPAPPLPERRLLDVVAGPGAAVQRRAARAEHWRGRLNPLPDRFAFPPRRPAGGADLVTQSNIDVDFPRDIGARLPAFAAEHQTTPFIVLLAAYRILLGRWTGWDRVVIGTAMLGRDVRGTHRMVGPFVENIYVATTSSGESALADVLRTVHEEVLTCIEHAASFTEIARAVNPDFDRQRPWPFLNLYDAWFQATAAANNDGGEGAGVRPAAIGRPSRAEWADREPGCPASLLLHAKRGEPGFILDDVRTGGSVVFNPSFYPEEMVRSVVRDYPAVIMALLDNPHQRVSEVGG
jgi:hypothetical protein